MKSLLLLFVLLLLSSDSSGGELPKNLLKLFKNTKTVHIVFNQKTVLPVAGNDVTLYRGEIFYRRPLKFLWRYTWGSRMEIISNGKEIETVFDDGSCQIAPLKENLNLFPLLLLAESPEKFTSEFQVVEDRRSGNSEVVVCRARGKDPFFREFVFFFKNGKLKSLKAVQSDGTEETFVLDRVEKNVPVKESLFRLRRCKG